MYGVYTSACVWRVHKCRRMACTQVQAYGVYTSAGVWRVHKCIQAYGVYTRDLKENECVSFENYFNLKLNE